MYQVLILCIVIFAAPGWLCEQYWQKCVTVTPVTDGDDKCAWNPFYVDGPYYLDNNS